MKEANLLFKPVRFFWKFAKGQDLQKTLQVFRRRRRKKAIPSKGMAWVQLVLVFL